MNRQTALAGAEDFLDWMASLMAPLEELQDGDVVVGDGASTAGATAASGAATGTGGVAQGVPVRRLPPLHVYTLPKRNPSAPFFAPDGKVVILNLWHSARIYRWGTADLAATQTTLKSVAGRLKTAQQTSPSAFATAADEVLQWGGVTRSNSAWIHAHAAPLMQSCQAIGAMHQAHVFSPTTFAGQGVRMNSGFTKIYAMLFDGFVMYDSRVAAAFALLLTIWADRGRPLPAFAADLCVFPGRSGHRVANGFAHRNSEAMHARANLVANWAIDALFLRHPHLARIWDTMVPGADRFRTIEAALFMLGYDIGTHPVIRRQVAPGAGGSSTAIALATRERAVAFEAVPLPAGYDLRFGTAFASRLFVPDTLIDQVATEFTGQDIAIGASRTAPPAGSLGEYLLANLSSTAAASYVAPLLVWLGIATYSPRRGHLRFP